MIGMRKLSGCQCRNMWQLTGGKESLASTWPMRIFTPRRPCRHRRWVLEDASRAYFCSNSTDGYYKLSSSVVCTFFMYGAAAAAISMIHRWFWPLLANPSTRWHVASDIVWTMDFGVGMDWNGVLPITRRLEPHMCHFCGILSVMPRRCNIVRTGRRNLNLKYYFNTWSIICVGIPPWILVQNSGFFLLLF